MVGTELDKSLALLSIVKIESEGDEACGDWEDKKPVKDVLMKGMDWLRWWGCWGCVVSWEVSDIRRWWKGAQALVWDAKESVFSKVLPHLQRKGILGYLIKKKEKRVSNKKENEVKKKGKPFYRQESLTNTHTHSRISTA